MYMAWRRPNCHGSLRPELFLIRSCHGALTASTHAHSVPAARVVLSLPKNWDSFSYEVFPYVVRAHQPQGTLSVFRIFFLAVGTFHRITRSHHTPQLPAQIIG